MHPTGAFAPLAAILLAVAFDPAQARPAPHGGAWGRVLSAPFNPFTATGALNVSVVPLQAAFARKVGVNTVWVDGSMAQFDTLALEEREAVAQAWVDAARGDQYLIINVASTVVADARRLAAHAQRIGADAIALLPPYYGGDRPPTAERVATFVANVADAAPKV